MTLARALAMALMFAAAARADQEVPVDTSPAETKKLAGKLACTFEPCVFDTEEFPASTLQGDEKVKTLLGAVKTETTFYNEKYEVVKVADSPGRYGAIVHITLGDGARQDRFVTLYRIPPNVPAQMVKLGKAKVLLETGAGSEIAQRQLEEVAVALKGAMGSEPLNSQRLALLAKALPGVSPDQLLSSFMAFMARDDAWWFELRKRVGLLETYPCQVQLPDSYTADPAKRWPLILYLHGAGDRGDDLSALNRNGLPKRIAGGRQLPAIVVSPQCKDAWWSSPVLSQLIDDVTVKYQVDPDRIVVTGLSMGGFGTWALAEAYPDRFSAIVPICGGGNPAGAARLRSLPIWAFHGQQDTTVPVYLSEAMISSIRAAGGDPHLTVYPDARHDAWTKTYASEALYTWMLAQQRGRPEAKTEGVQEN